MPISAGFGPQDGHGQASDQLLPEGTTESLTGVVGAIFAGDFSGEVSRTEATSRRIRRVKSKFSLSGLGGSCKNILNQSTNMTTRRRFHITKGTFRVM